MKRKSVLAILLSTALTVSTVTPVTAVAAEEPVLQTSQEELPAITDVGTEVNDLVDVSLEQTDEAAGNFRIVFTPDKEMADQFTKFTCKVLAVHKFSDPSQSGFNRRRSIVQVITVQTESHFKTKSITRTKPYRFYAKLSSGFKKLHPKSSWQHPDKNIVQIHLLRYIPYWK